MLIGLCGVGFAASLAALLVGFVPPSQFGGGNPLVYFLIVGGGALGLGLLVPFLFYRLRKPSWKLPEGDGGEPVMTNYEGESERTTASSTGWPGGSWRCSSHRTRDLRLRPRHETGVGTRPTS